MVDEDETPSSSPAPKRGAADRFLGSIERIGNLLPDPVTLFALLALGVVVASGIASWLGLEVVDPRPEGTAGRSPDGVIRAVSLLSADGIRRIVANLVVNFTGFAPLGVVLVALLGVGVAEASGLLGAAIRALVLRAPPSLVTVTIVFTGVLSNAASEMGYVVLIPLGGTIYLSLGRHPIAGMAAAFAGVSGGYSANLVIGTVDPLLAGLTEISAQIIVSGYKVSPLANWYFMIGSTFLITILGTLVSLYVVEPRLGSYAALHGDTDGVGSPKIVPLEPIEKRGLWLAFATVAVLTLVTAALVVPEGAVLRNPTTGEILDSPFLKGVVALVFVFFLVPGVAYGWVTRSIRSDRDVIEGMSKAMGSMGLYIVLVFFAAQFIAYFEWSGLGTILAVFGADGLKSLGLTGPGIFAVFIVLSTVLNLFMGSASAKWAVTAPVFVPMLMLLGYTPEVIQCAYRIGDSCTNVITPMMSYFGLILAMMRRYDRRVGIGTMVSTMLPYSIVFLIGWTAFFYLWVFGLDLPVGVGTELYLEGAGG
jgi:aminobenzoyl-glutamate transport protein